jgi:hypothetical protein
MMALTIILVTMEAEVGGSRSKSKPGKSTRHYLENKLRQKKKREDWGYDLSGKAPAYQSRGLDFKPQCFKTNKQTNKR